VTASVGTALAEAARRLQGAGIEGAPHEARLLLASVLGVATASLVGYPERALTPGEGGRYELLIDRRARREPLTHILGRREFWGLSFRVTADTLDPRPDSETLIEAVLGELPDRQAPLRLLDLGTGTGCLLLALLSELPQATGLGVDCSAAALAVATANASDLGLAGRAAFRLGRWGEGLSGPFDLIVSNPPYIPSGDIGGLMPEVARYEPHLALDGGPDGLDSYRMLGAEIARLLTGTGLAALEIGLGQAPAVAALLAADGVAQATLRRDLAGHIRCLVFRKMAAVSERSGQFPPAKKTVGKRGVPV
jgi:release factor glutamine methyltransferase